MAENEKLQQVRNHKEKVSKVLFNNDFFEEKDGKEYPKNRLVVNLVSYS
ncbi:MAG: hypothetical protein LBU14_02125 [Candidatus Peribacteria bacterium]|jgi:hypothetical protein|nr:hypothetical protein [Candidatus Peribacteria bacterium]